MIRTITTEELTQRLRDTRIIDLRDRQYYFMGHIEGAYWLPYLLAMANADELFHPDEPVVFYDEQGGNGRAKDVADTLERMGYDHIFIYEQGWRGWQQAHRSSLKDTVYQ